MRLFELTILIVVLALWGVMAQDAPPATTVPVTEPTPVELTPESVSLLVQQARAANDRKARAISAYRRAAEQKADEAEAAADTPDVED